MSREADARPVTRLAPSPTGALHLGNARTFLVNWALARREGWRILLRIEDLDTPRVKPGAAEETVDILRWLGLDWDDAAPPLVQSHDLEPYRRAMQTLAARGLVFPSPHSRRELEEAASAPQEGSGEVPFPRALRPADRPRTFADAGENWRFALPDDAAVAFTDRFAGEQRIDLSAEADASAGGADEGNGAGSGAGWGVGWGVGDFIVWTKRSCPAYQLAVVVDDHRQGVTRIVRGDDLLGSAARQLLLYRALGYAPEPEYTHLPLVRGEDGRRLAKRHGDTRLAHYRALGVPPERIVGLCARWCGCNPEARPMDAAEFAERLDLGTMPRGDVTFTREDDRWLLGS